MILYLELFFQIVSILDIQLPEHGITKGVSYFIYC